MCFALRRKLPLTSALITATLLIAPTQASAPPTATPVFASEPHIAAEVQIPQRDPALETQLDQLLDSDLYPSDREALRQLLRTVDINTPVETFVRAHAYQVVALAHEQKMSAAMAIANEVQTIAEKSDNSNAIAEARVMLGEAHFAAADFEAALKHARHLTDLLHTVTQPRVRYTANHFIARALQQNGEFSEALEFLLAAQALVPQTEASGQQRRRQFLNLHLARIQANLGRWQASASTAEQAIADAKRSGITHHLPDLYLIRAYSQQYDQGPSDEIVAAFVAAAEAGRDMNNPRVEMLAFNNAGAAKLLMNELDAAREFLEQGLAVAKRINNVNERSVTEFNLGYIKVLQGQHQQGIAEMLAAAEVFNSFAQKREKAILLTHIAKAYEVAGDYQKQAQTLHQQVQLTAELAEEESNERISELQVRYQAAEKSYEIKLLEQQAELREKELAAQKRQYQFFVLAAGSLILLILLFAFGYRKTRKLNNLLNSANQELHQQSLRDPLTGLYNRRAIYDQLLRGDQRIYSGNHAVLILDIDHFKAINDRHGHNVGDEVLIEFGRRVKNALRRSDLAVRWGGEEFLLLLENVQADEALKVAGKLLQEIGERSFDTSAGPLPITVSGGFALVTASPNPPDWETTVKQVDELLYQAKREGRNRIRYQLPGEQPASLKLLR
ncbi:GGDEF domain-containing protein [Pseudidiomarina insulisalsae]|uniref:diguanylate cyclase n=1 Tax=Pseudidiomarina insulisalsae TaxID=575789 RepID=A0A432YI14_9GAMM|nr:GGDEF domain-containing protein [Pseudidiomarina insulisalsae]RUO60601.1 hypothetical protein CWI71_06995 [Pseudidiomarina insulisalsae]